MSRKFNHKISQRLTLIFERRPGTRLVGLSQSRRDKRSPLKQKTEDNLLG